MSVSWASDSQAHVEGVVNVTAEYVVASVAVVVKDHIGLESQIVECSQLGERRCAAWGRQSAKNLKIGSGGVESLSTRTIQRACRERFDNVLQTVAVYIY